jgi:hypothetical protein
MKHPIPPMTHELSRHWKQPPREAILVDETHALMELGTFEQLAEYTLTDPSGVYPGKMWRCDSHKGWWALCWYGPLDAADCCCVYSRKIAIL